MDFIEEEGFYTFSHFRPTNLKNGHTKCMPIFNVQGSKCESLVSQFNNLNARRATKSAF
jgi:hypothetical protein